jgi:hypothetical protein
VKLRRAQGSAESAADERRDGIHGAVKADIQQIFKGKSYKELALLETQVCERVFETSHFLHR